MHGTTTRGHHAGGASTSQIGSSGTNHKSVKSNGLPTKGLANGGCNKTFINNREMSRVEDKTSLNGTVSTNSGNTPKSLEEPQDDNSIAKSAPLEREKAEASTTTENIASLNHAELKSLNLNEKRHCFIKQWIKGGEMTLDDLFGTNIGGGNGFHIYKPSPDKKAYVIVITYLDDYLETFDAMPMIFLNCNSPDKRVQVSMHIYGAKVENLAGDFFCKISKLVSKTLTPLGKHNSLPRALIDGYNNSIMNKDEPSFKPRVETRQELECRLSQWNKNPSDENEEGPASVQRHASRRKPHSTSFNNEWLNHIKKSAHKEISEANTTFDNAAKAISDAKFLNDEIKAELTEAFKKALNQGRTLSTLAYAPDYLDRYSSNQKDRFYYLSMATLITGQQSPIFSEA